MRDVPITIVGGGCAGLSLANALIERPIEGPIRIVEPRSHYRRDRTWSFWDVGDAIPADLVRHRWSRWSVREDGRVAVRRSTRHAYCEVPADAFYQRSLERLADDPRVDLALGDEVEALEPDGRGCRVETTQGSFRTGRVFDSRPDLVDARSRAPGSKRPLAGPNGLWQHFLGLHLRADRALFDPDTVTLMDFDVDQSRGIHFVYVLPHAPDEALVESTCFSPTPEDSSFYRRSIDRYLARRFPRATIEIVDRESGRIPMFEVAGRPRQPRLHAIGLAGGAARPSTGYAFLAIQRQSRRIAEWVERGAAGAPPLRHRSTATRLLDRVFLGRLERSPETAPALFFRLFERARSDSLVRFLMERGSLGDTLEVMRALPTVEFTREALRTVPGRVPGRVPG